MTQEYEFTIGSHNEQAHDYTSALIDEAYKRKADDRPTTSNERVGKAGALCEAYYAQMDDKPAQAVLSRLAWYIVFDEMTDDHPDKMTREEYPIATGKQLFRRKDRYSLLSDIDYEGRESNGRVKRPFTTKNGAEWVTNSKLAFPFTDGTEDFIRKDTVTSLLNGARLTDKQRQTIVGVYFEGKTQEKVAEEMGVSRQMVQRHSSVAFDKMSAYVRKIGFSNLL